MPTVTRAAPVPMAPATAIGVAQSPAELDRGARPWTSATRRRRGVQLARLPVPRPVEVDDVEPGRPLGHEPRGDRDRVAAVGGLARRSRPAASRTTRPPRMSIAGSSSNTASGPTSDVDTHSPQLLAY